MNLNYQFMTYCSLLINSFPLNVNLTFIIIRLFQLKHDTIFNPIISKFNFIINSQNTLINIFKLNYKL